MRLPLRQRFLPDGLRRRAPAGVLAVLLAAAPIVAMPVAAAAPAVNGQSVTVTVDAVTPSTAADAPTQQPLTFALTLVNHSDQTLDGLQVEAELDASSCPLGVSVSAERMRTLPIAPHAAQGMWNYTIRPSGRDAQCAIRSGGRDRSRSDALHALPILG